MYRSVAVQGNVGLIQMLQKKNENMREFMNSSLTN